MSTQTTCGNVTSHNINPQQIYNYMDNYYKSIIQRLQSNYGKVYVKCSKESQDAFITQTIPYADAVLEKDQRQLLGKISFESFFNHTQPHQSNLSTPDNQSFNDAHFSIPAHDLISHATSLDPSDFPYHAKNLDKNAQEIQQLSLPSGDSSAFIGKGLYLGRDVEEGDVVFSERPIASLNLDSAYVQSCDFCLRAVGNIDEQIWTMLMAGTKTAASTGPKDILALLNKINGFEDVIREYAHLSAMDSDNEDDGDDNASNQKLTREEKAANKLKLNEDELTQQNKAKLLSFYQDIVLKQYNYVLKSLHQQEKQMALANPSSTDATIASDSLQGDEYDINEIMKDTYDLLESLPEGHILDVNELSSNHVQFVEPPQTLAEVTPLFSPYSDSVYCSLRCLCMAYNNYDHILVHAYPQVNIDQVNGDVSLLGDGFQIDDADSDDNESGDEAIPTTAAEKPATKKDSAKKNALHKTPLPPKNSQIKGVLTTSTVQPIGPSGLPFLHQSQLYLDLKYMSKSTNEMFLSHIRAITQSLSYWGSALIRTLGGDYNDVISLLVLNGQYISINNSPIFNNNTIVDYEVMTTVNNYFIDKQVDKYIVLPDVLDQQTQLQQQFLQLKTTLVSTFNSKIQNTIDHHIAFVQENIWHSTNSVKDQQQELNEENPFNIFDPEANSQPYIITKNFHHECYCSNCLNELSYNLLQYSLFPYLMFTQTQWWCHIYDDNNQNFYQSVAASNKSGNYANKEATLFDSQIAMLQALEQIYEPIIMNYAKTIALYCSFITSLYPKCLRKNPNDAVCAETQPPPYFTDILYKTSQLDPEKVMYIPYSEQNVKETMNNIIFRVQQYSDNIQRPLDCTHWMFISHFVAMCEMNNMAISLKTAATDVVEFFTIHNLHELEPDDVEDVEEQIKNMHKAALNVYKREKKLDTVDPAQLPAYLQSSDAYLDFVLSSSSEFNKPAKKTVKKGATTSAANPNGDATKAWTLLRKRAENYPEASGLFRVGCTMNHNCNPNITMVPLDIGRINIMAGVATRNIKKGEELNIAYVQSDELTYKERQAKLKDYQFQCTCDMCVADKKRIMAQMKAKQEATKKALTPGALSATTKPPASRVAPSNAKPTAKTAPKK